VRERRRAWRRQLCGLCSIAKEKSGEGVRISACALQRHAPRAATAATVLAPAHAGKLGRYRSHLRERPGQRNGFFGHVLVQERTGRIIAGAHGGLLRRPPPAWPVGSRPVPRPGTGPVAGPRCWTSAVWTTVISILTQDNDKQSDR